MSASALGGAHAAPQKRPNIIVILADDMGFSDIGCYGSEIATPNLDRLAKSGLRFTHFYNTARCCPTRASIQTGLYPHQAGIGHMTEDYGKPGYRGDLNRQCVTMAEVMRAGGYHTLMTGKWHVTPYHADDKHNWPLQRGYEHYYGIIMGAASYFNPASLTRDNTPVEPEGKDYYLTDALGDQAAAYVGEYARKAEPYFMYSAFTASHWPLHARPEEIEKYRNRYRDGWDALRAERHERMIKMGLVNGKWRLTPRDVDVPAWKDAPDKEWQMHRMAVYAAQIDRLDQNIGKILAKVRETGTEDNTLIMFMADNGGCAEELRDNRSPFMPEFTRLDHRPVRRGNNPAVMPGAEDTYQSYGLPWANASNTPFRRYKHWVHEGGISTPLVAYWPSVIKQHGALTHQAGHIIDIMATCSDAGSAPYPKAYQGNDITPLEGKSLVPIFQGKQRPGHEAIYWEHEGNRAVHKGNWKVVSRYPEKWELYDLEADRTELNDLSAKHPDRLKEMTGMYDAWARRSNVLPWDEVRPRRR